MKIIKEGLLAIITLMLFTSAINSQTWEEIGFNLPEGDTASSRTEITFENKDIGWLFTKHQNTSKLFKTTNGGINWQTMKVFSGLDYAVAYSKEPDFFYMINGKYGMSSGYAARFTTDGGITWDSAQISGKDFSSLYFFNEEKGIAMSDTYSWTTTNGGKTWDKKGMIVLPKDIFFQNENFGWAVGYGPVANDVGYIAKTTDGGGTWEYIEEISAFFLDEFRIEFIDSLNGFVIGETLTKTNDGGEHWNSNNKVLGYDVGFLNNKYGWISSAGQIYRTNDGGETWNKQFDNYINYRLVKLIILKEDKTAYILGVNPDSNSATLFKADLSSITSVEDNKEAIPDRYYLSQNYPNPFNPSTVISYHLPVNSFVNLTIYDLLGREAAVLVNEDKKAGLNTVTWNATGFTSGIYIARITAGEFNKTIKLSFLK